MWTQIALTSWLLAIADVILLLAHPEEDDASFSIYLYKITLAFYNLPCYICKVVTEPDGSTYIRMNTPGSNLDAVVLMSSNVSLACVDK